jgi:hypothetical protein
MNTKEHVNGWKSWLVFVIVCLLTIWLLRFENNVNEPISIDMNRTTIPCELNGDSVSCLFPDDHTLTCNNTIFVKQGYAYCDIDDVVNNDN